MQKQSLTANSLMRYVSTVKSMPVSKIVERLKNRSRRTWTSLFPLGEMRSLSRRTINPPRIDYQSSNLIQAASSYSKLPHEASKFIEFSAGHLAVEIQGQKETVSTAEPFKVQVDEGNCHLWKMTFGYCGFLMDEKVIDRSESLHCLSDLLDAWTSNACFSEKGIFNDQWHPYTVSHRLINTILFITGYLNKHKLASLPEQLCDFNRLLAIHAEFLRRNLETDLGFNHYAKNLLALVVYQIATSGTVDDWLSIEYCKTIRSQVLPDGGHAELSPMYHRLFLTDLEVLREITQGLATSLNECASSCIAAMTDAYRVMSFGTGDYPCFGDAWHLGQRSCGKVPFEDGIDELPDTGLIHLRRGKSEVIIDVGPGGPRENPGHAHDDFLAIEIELESHSAIVDTGVPTYSQGEARTFSRSNLAHNGPRLAGLMGLECWGSFRVGRMAPRPEWKRLSANNIQGVKTSFQPLDSNYILERYVILCDVGIIIYDCSDAPVHESRIATSFCIPEDAWDFTQPFPKFKHGDWHLYTNCESTITSSEYFRMYGVPSKSRTLHLSTKVDSICTANILLISPFAHRPTAMQIALETISAIGFDHRL